MSEKKFKRGFEDSLLNRTKDFFNTPIGKRITSPKKNTYQICFRDKYINVYFKGFSILKYAPNAEKNKFMIHYKYTEPKIDNYSPKESQKDYINLKLIDNDNDLSPEKTTPDSSNWKFSKLLEKPEIMIKKSSKGEKHTIALYLEKFHEKGNFLMLDLEVAFTRKPEDKKKRNYVADRIDMVCIYLDDNKNPVLKLIEIKEANDKRLKNDYKESDGKKIENPNKPEIMTQMKHYSEFIKKEKMDGIKISYQKVAKNYFDLIDEGILPDTYFPKQILGKNTKDILKEFYTSPNPNIDSQPYLLIIERKGEYEEGKCSKKLLEKGRNQQNHWERLQNLFKEEGYPEPMYKTI